MLHESPELLRNVQLSTDMWGTPSATSPPDTTAVLSSNLELFIDTVLLENSRIAAMSVVIPLIVESIIVMLTEVKVISADATAAGCCVTVTPAMRSQICV